MSSQYPLVFLFVAVALIALAGVFALPRHRGWSLVLKFVAALALGVAMTVEGATPVTPGKTTLSIVTAMLWWVAVAWFVTALARWIAWRGSDAAHTIRTRKLVVELIAVAGWSIALVAIAGLLFDQPVTGMIATSGIVAIVLGLALQNTLADLFAGLALNVERPYRAGDWITFDGIEGQVIETNWRATHVRNRFGDLVVVPNGSIAKARLVNHCLPTKRSLLRVLVGLSNETDPQEASAVLREAAAATSRILTDPGPVILLNNFDGTTVVYAVFVYLEDYAAVPFIRSELIANIVTHTNRRGIILSIPRQEVVLRPDLVPAANG